MDFQSFVFNGFLALISFIGLFTAKEIKDLAKSVDKLSKEVAGLGEQGRWLKATDERHEERITRLENKIV